MKRVVFLILSLAVLIGMGLATSAAVAKDGVFGDMRWRWESFKNFEDWDSDVDDTWTAHYLRARLGYQGRLGETGFYKMSVENMRVLGGDFPSPFSGDFGMFPAKDISFGYWPELVARPLGTNNSGIFVHEAYFGAEDFLFNAFSLKFGRFALNYGRERLIGSNDWSNHSVNRFDGAIGQIGFETGWIDLLWLKLAESGFESDDIGFLGDFGDVNLRGAYGHFDLSEGFFIEPHLLWFNANDKTPDPADVDEEIDDTNIYGFGALVDFMSDMGLHLYGEAQFQTGSSSEVIGGEIFETDISALGFYAGAFYSFASDIEPFLGVEYNYASGVSEDDDPDEMKMFLNPFGSNTEYLGRMNMIGWGQNLTQYESTQLGISALRFAGGLSASEAFDISANFFLFSTAEDYTFGPIGEEDEGSSIGSEIDIQLDYYYNDFLSFEGGLGLFSFDEDYIGTDEADSIWYNWIGSRIAF